VAPSAPGRHAEPVKRALRGHQPWTGCVQGQYRRVLYTSGARRRTNLGAAIFGRAFAQVGGSKYWSGAVVASPHSRWEAGCFQLVWHRTWSVVSESIKSCRHLVGEKHVSGCGQSADLTR
jgi:hypothetical protein